MAKAKRDWVHWALIGAVVFLIGVNVLYVFGRRGRLVEGELAPTFALPAFERARGDWAELDTAKLEGKILVVSFFATT